MGSPAISYGSCRARWPPKRNAVKPPINPRQNEFTTGRTLSSRWRRRTGHDRLERLDHNPGALSRNIMPREAPGPAINDSGVGLARVIRANVGYSVPKPPHFGLLPRPTELSGDVCKTIFRYYKKCTGRKVIYPDTRGNRR